MRHTDAGEMIKRKINAMTLYQVLVRCAAIRSSIALNYIRPISHLPRYRFRSFCTSSDAASDVKWKLNLLYDSECPICLHEIEFLKKRDSTGKIKFTDIADVNYDGSAAENGNINFEEGMKYLHAVTSDGKVLRGMEVMRETYNLIGLGWIYSATNLPAIGPFFNFLYDVWAGQRLRLTGRPDLQIILANRSKKLSKLRREGITCKG